MKIYEPISLQSFVSDPCLTTPDSILGLFRIIQEGLRNVHRHSGTTKAQVDVKREPDKLRVFISDQGAGFDTRKLGTKQGLGLLSMEARTRLLGGHFEIHSEPGKGTRLEVWVPLELPSGPGSS